ncbi:ribitol-5-phosphate xylosyltransferase 1-like [Asterias amurensis]|uniref:ribitol-5-phosphate xylosyltransferase 1-like n=1 Tax=Asterias amurensis TaxID=7602 RepID=UPI003AB858F7
MALSAMRPRVSLKRLSILIGAIYLLVSFYWAYVLLSQKSSDTSEARSDKRAQDSRILSPVNLGTTQQRHHEPAKESNISKTHDVLLAKNTYSDAKEEHAVEIWSRAGVGQYTWEHILGATLETRQQADSQYTLSYGYKKEGHIAFTFRTGHDVLPSTVPRDVENLLLVLNARAPDKVDFARAWLDNLDAFTRLRNVGLMLIGSEQCQNSWVLQYMKSHGGPLRFLLVVYDTLLVDGREILQWPLGVATYRGFPVVNITKLNPSASRRYRCNFMATVYPNSSRETLLQVIKKNNLADYCYVKTRESWTATEQEETRLEYEGILAQSDLTLSPVGMNTECYRIYEAASYGSVPVVEDITTPGECASEPLRLLKQYNAPFIYIKDWQQLPQVLLEESKKSPREISQRREELLRWYGQFRIKLKQVFLDTIQKSFFPT